MSDGRFDLEISRIMKAPRAKVWRAFADRLTWRSGGARARGSPR